MTTTTTDFVVRPILAGDEPGVLNLLRRSLGEGPTGQLTPAFYRWKHHANPFGKSPGLVAEQDGRLVGVRLFLRWELMAGGQRIRAVRAVDTATDPAFQGQGIFRRLTLDLLSRLEEAGEVDLVFNTPNGNSRPGYLRMGWQDVGTLPVRLSPIRPVRFLRGARAAARTTATASRGEAPVETTVAPTPECTFPPAAVWLDQRRNEIETLIAETASPVGIHTPRTMTYLKWRYGASTELDYRCIGVESGRHLGGLAFGRMRRRGPLQEFTVSELFTRSGDRQSARRLLSAARRSQADHVVTLTAGGSEADHVALTAGYLVAPRRGLSLVANPRGTLPVDVLDPRAWGLSLGDLEVF